MAQQDELEFREPRRGASAGRVRLLAQPVAGIKDRPGHDPPASVLVILTLGGLEDAFRELSEPTAQAHGLPPRPDGPPPIARMAEVLGARGISFAP